MDISKVRTPRENLKTSEEKLPPPETVAADPRELLHDLREKQKLFATLKSEGLIHREQHANLEQRLRETIAELEKLIPQLEGA